MLQESEMHVIWKEQEMKFKKIAAAAGAAAFAIAGMGLGVAAANATEQAVQPNGTITINGSTSVEHNLKGYLLATYSDIDVDGTTLNSFNITTNPAYTTAIEHALTADQHSEYVQSAENGNPMAWVVSNLSAAQLRQFGINLQTNGALNDDPGTAFKLGKNSVPTGYYLITDQTTDDMLQGKPETISQPMILSTTVNAATQDSKGNTLGTVNLKNSTTEIYKQVVKTGSAGAYVSNTQPDYAIGDTVSYELTSKTPDFNGYNIDPTRQNEENTRVFTITDTMSKGLTYNSIESVKVGDTTLKAGADYDVTTAEVPAADAKYAGGTKVTIDLGKYVNKAAGSTLAGSANEIPAGEPVTVIVKATLNKNAAISTPSSIQANPNKVELEFSHNPSDNSKKTTTPGGEVNVYTFKLQVKKTDKSGSTPLQGAEFTVKLVSADNNPNADKYLASKDANGNWTYTNNENDAYKFTSNDQGIISGIDGIDAGTYEVHETKAPAGYLSANFQAIKFQVKVTPNYDQDNSTKPESKTVWGDNNAKTEVIEEGTGDSGNMVAKNGTVDYQFDVKNAKSFTQLPLTGATGMRMLTIAALIAASAGAILVVRARRMRADI